jgi:hypothetical protein
MPRKPRPYLAGVPGHKKGTDLFLSTLEVAKKGTDLFSRERFANEALAGVA